EMLGKLTENGAIEVPKGDSCDTGDRSRWRWFQPPVTTNKSVDLLFVVDSSLSLITQRKALAKSISHFLATLPSDADPRVAVMLGHGGSSTWSGKLYSRSGDPRVINPTALTLKQSEKFLENSLTCPAVDFGFGNGEMLMYSLMESLEDARFAEIRSQGFYRPDASLAVVFLTDENDTCFDPLKHGYTKAPDYRPSFFGLEKVAYKRYCLNDKGALRVSTTAVISSLRNRFPGKPITMAGIVHTDPSGIFQYGEEAIGHGIIELVQENAAGNPTGPTSSLLMDIISGDFGTTLQQLGSMVTTKFSLMTSFPLTGEMEVDTDTLLVTVDGKEVSATYDAATRTINIPGIEAGLPGSQVDVSACSL
ncbi:hypothetical protein EBZ37_03955, partial [bacterium]|nr:hypothetical protein [bacterium]